MGKPLRPVYPVTFQADLDTYVEFDEIRTALPGPTPVKEFEKKRAYNEALKFWVIIRRNPDLLDRVQREANADECQSKNK